MDFHASNDLDGTKQKVIFYTWRCQICQWNFICLQPNHWMNLRENFLEFPALYERKSVTFSCTSIYLFICSLASVRPYLGCVPMYHWPLARLQYYVFGSNLKSLDHHLSTLMAARYLRSEYWIMRTKISDHLLVIGMQYVYMNRRVQV